MVIYRQLSPCVAGGLRLDILPPQSPQVFVPSPFGFFPGLVAPAEGGHPWSPCASFLCAGARCSGRRKRHGGGHQVAQAGETDRPGHAGTCRRLAHRLVEYNRPPFTNAKNSVDDPAELLTGLHGERLPFKKGGRQEGRRAFRDRPRPYEADATRPRPPCGFRTRPVSNTSRRPTSASRRLVQEGQERVSPRELAQYRPGGPGHRPT